MPISPHIHRLARIPATLRQMASERPSSTAPAQNSIEPIHGVGGGDDEDEFHPGRREWSPWPLEDWWPIDT